jgi:hypothetical protein
LAEVTCPRCNVRIPSEMPECPFCRKAVDPLPPEKEERRDIRDLLVPQESFPGLKSFYRRYGKWLKLSAPILIAVPTLWVIFLLLTGLSIDIPGDPVFPIEATAVKKGGRVILLKGTVTNLGEDVLDLSLRSIGVTAEFRWNDGKAERKRAFPKSDFRGEGALFRGESGAFEFDVPPGADAVILRAEIVNLGGDRPFRLPLQGREGKRK